MTATIYRYQPVVIPGPMGTDYLPTGPDGEGFHDTLTDLCDCDGWRYVAVPAGITPQVPAELTTWSAVELTAELREQIKQASAHCNLIAQRVIGKIRAVYTLDDELYFARIAVGNLQGTYSLQPGEAEALAQYQLVVEAAREWGREMRENLGL
jgi:hypothetical protein